jgi:DNA phosphorothioation-associated putative methyltransferase
MQLAVAHGVLPQGTTIFDYGCGLGDDVAALAAAGYEAFGWDPHHAPDGPRRAADLVNLGFILNVVEDIVTPDGRGPRLAELQNLMRMRRDARPGTPADAGGAADHVESAPSAAKATP